MTSTQVSFVNFNFIVNSAHLDHLGFRHQGQSSQRNFQFHSSSCRRWGGSAYPLPNGVPSGGPNPAWTVYDLNQLRFPPSFQVGISSLTILQTILQFQVRATTNVWAQKSSPQIVSFNSAVRRGANFTIGGDAGYPTITFDSMTNTQEDGIVF